MKANKMNHPNEGINCIVSTCHYYMAGDHCSADKIVVEPREAKTSNQTDCATFMPHGK